MLCGSGCYFQEGTEVKMEMDLRTAFQKSIETLVDFVTSQVDTNKTQVLFRTYAPVHFRFTQIAFLIILSILNCLFGCSILLFQLGFFTIFTLSGISIKMDMNIGYTYYSYQPSSLPLFGKHMIVNPFEHDSALIA